MKIPPSYVIDNELVNLLQECEHLKTTFDLLPQDKIAEKFSREKSMLKSSVFSARIEGNPKTLDEISLASLKRPRTRGNLEISNLYRALELVNAKGWKQEIKKEDLKKIHNLVMQGLSSEAGSFRQEPSAIFNMAGVAIYLCPMPYELPDLMGQFLKYLNVETKESQLVKAGNLHFLFERIHPFLDGNGRVGRLLIHLVLKKYGYDFRGLVSFEEFIDTHRQEYYEVLQVSQKNIVAFSKFFLRGLISGLQSAVKSKKQKKKITPEDRLSPRRWEILQVIRDHKQVSFDFIRRRFMAVSPRLLRYDLKKLQDAGFIKKRGVTKGVVYEPVTA